MSTILPFPREAYEERINARNQLASFINSLGCASEIAEKTARLIEAIDKNNYNVIKFEHKK